MSTLRVAIAQPMQGGEGAHDLTIDVAARADEVIQ
jgi:hypothetical protein